MAEYHSGDVDFHHYVSTSERVQETNDEVVPAAAGYVDESDLIPYFEQLLELFIEVEQQKYIIVDNKRYDNVFIKCWLWLT